MILSNKDAKNNKRLYGIRLIKRKIQWKIERIIIWAVSVFGIFWKKWIKKDIEIIY